MESSVLDPLVTVVIPTFDRLPLLRAAIDSVRAQTYARWQVVVVDDGSTDGTAEAVREMGDPRVRLVARPHDAHLGRARNAGAAAGDGELLAFLDSDDLWLAGKLEAQVRALRESGAEWCYTGFEMMDGGGGTIPLRAGSFVPLSGWIAPDLITTRTGALVCTLLLRRALFERVGRFSEDARLPFRGDLELAMRLAARAPAVCVAEALVRVREHAARTTGALAEPFELSAMAYEIFLSSHAAPSLARLARQRHGELLAGAAAHRLARGHYLAAARQLAGALRDGAGPRRVLSALRSGARGRLRAER